jgi:Tol biopolymer transport system component
MLTSIFKYFNRAVATGLYTAVTAATAWAAFPGQNGRIVFTADTTGVIQLYTINPDGSDMVQVTNLLPTQTSTQLPSFAPDGVRIVFTTNAPDMPNTGDLFVINADGTGLTRLTNDGLSNAAQWSPDGSRIVFAHTSIYGTNVITTMSADGTGEMTSLTPDIWDAFGNTYTPDGRVAFSSQLGGLLVATWIADAKGGNKRRLTPASLEIAGPNASPDGHSLLVFNTAIYVVTVSDPHTVQLTYPGSAIDVWPSYSPDGKQIVFASSRLSSDGSLDLFVMNADGSNIHRIAAGLAAAGCQDACPYPSWGPKP